MSRLVEPLLRPAVLWLLLLVFAAAAAGQFDLTRLGAWAFGGVTGDPVLLQWAAAALIGGGVVANFWLLSFAPRVAQIAIVWVELMALFLAFCWSFGLSYVFMWSRTPILLGLELRDGFIQGAALTVFLCLVSIACSTVIALAMALMRLSTNGAAFGIATFYTSFFRGTPLLLQIFLIYLGLPQLGIVISAIPAGIIALSLCYGAYMAEIFRAGILAVPRGQGEAALSLGLTPHDVTWLVILPQAMRLIIPPTGNQFIAMLKDSSLVSVMGVWEVMFLARTHGRSDFKYMEMLIVAAVIYWALSFVFELLQARIEKHYGKGVRVR
jgi:polar amino acid transport system permease protein